MLGLRVAGMLDGIEYVDQQIAEAMRAAAREIHDEGIAARVRRFAEDHDAHVAEFADLTERMEWLPQGPPDRVRRVADQRRRLAEAARGQDEAIEALIDIEQAGLDELRGAFESGPPDEAAAILSRHIDDEQRHVDYLLAKSPRVRAREPETTHARR